MSGHDVKLPLISSGLLEKVGRPSSKVSFQTESSPRILTGKMEFSSATHTPLIEKASASSVCDVDTAERLSKLGCATVALYLS